MDIEFVAGESRALEVLLFDFDLRPGISGGCGWQTPKGSFAAVLQEIEACVTGSRSLFCVWRVGDVVGEAALSCDLVRGTLLPLVAGSRCAGVSVFYVPDVCFGVAPRLDSRWHVDVGGSSVRGGICVEKSPDCYKVRFESQRLYSHVQVSAVGGQGVGSYVHPILVQSDGARRRAIPASHIREELAALAESQASPAREDGEASVAPCGRAVGWQDYLVGG